MEAVEASEARRASPGKQQGSVDDRLNNEICPEDQRTATPPKDI